MSSNSNAANAGKLIKTGGFIARLFGYAFFYVPIGVVLLITAALGGAKDIVRIFGIPNTDLAISIVLFGGLAIPFVLWEMSIRRFRRKHGLSIWKNVSAELEQMAIDEQVAKEHKAFANNGIVKDPSGDKTDIGYWFGLLEKGAITQAEYEAKKKELL
jgi:hypothetical protein